LSSRHEKCCQILEFTTLEAYCELQWFINSGRSLIPRKSISH
jgi:hypothetical protein